MLKNLGRLGYFLGMEAHWTDVGLLLTQQKYIMNLLSKARMIDCKEISTPASSKDKITAAQDPLFFLSYFV